MGRGEELQEELPLLIGYVEREAESGGAVSVAVKDTDYHQIDNF